MKTAVTIGSPAFAAVASLVLALLSACDPVDPPMAETRAIEPQGLGLPGQAGGCREETRLPEPEQDLRALDTLNALRSQTYVVLLRLVAAEADLHSRYIQAAVEQHLAQRACERVKAFAELRPDDPGSRRAMTIAKARLRDAHLAYEAAAASVLEASLERQRACDALTSTAIRCAELREAVCRAMPDPTAGSQHLGNVEVEQLRDRVHKAIKLLDRVEENHIRRDIEQKLKDRLPTMTTVRAEEERP